MRTTLFNRLLLMLSFSLMSSMCSTDDDGSPNNNSQQITEIENTAQSGTWRITNFNDSGQNETSNLNGITLHSTPMAHL